MKKFLCIFLLTATSIQMYANHTLWVNYIIDAIERDPFPLRIDTSNKVNLTLPKNVIVEFELTSKKDIALIAMKIKSDDKILLTPHIDCSWGCGAKIEMNSKKYNIPFNNFSIIMKPTKVR